MQYSDLTFKQPQESASYKEDSAFVVQRIKDILRARRDVGLNKITLQISLKRGLPMENVNKLAGPLVEAWALEVFDELDKGVDTAYSLLHVEAQARQDAADILLQFSRADRILTAYTDVKASSDDIPSGGRTPNITSFARIRTAYVQDPDYMFIVLSLRHCVHPDFRIPGKSAWVMEITGEQVYDLKYLSDKDISYNPALGTGQIQVRDVHYISLQDRDTWEMCRLLDAKYLQSSKRTFADYYKLAKKYKWIKESR